MGTASSTVKNIEQFLETIKSTVLGANDILVSFDIVSLLTSGPTEEALNIVRKRLGNGLDLEVRTNLEELLTLCIKTTYFQFGREFTNRNLVWQ